MHNDNFLDVPRVDVNPAGNHHVFFAAADVVASVEAKTQVAGEQPLTPVLVAGVKVRGREPGNSSEDFVHQGHALGVLHEEDEGVDRAVSIDEVAVLGNAVTVPVARWIGRRIMTADAAMRLRAAAEALS